MYGRRDLVDAHLFLRGRLRLGSFLLDFFRLLRLLLRLGGLYLRSLLRCFIRVCCRNERRKERRERHVVLWSTCSVQLRQDAFARTRKQWACGL